MEARRLRQLADLLTASRAFIAIALVLLSFWGKRALSAVIFLLILGWTTDVFDGRLARRSQEPPTPISGHDFTLDMAMVFASLAYLALTDFVPLEYAAVYTLIAGVFIALFRSKSVTELLAFPIVALPLLIAYREAPFAAYAFTAWILLALLLDWGRFVGVVQEFIAGVKQLDRKA